MKFIKYLSSTIGLLCLIVGIGSAQETVVSQTLLMTFIPNIQFAPIYVAIGGGYFAEGGLEIDLQYLNEPDVVDLVASEEFNYGIVSGEQVILASAQGRPIVYVYEWFQQYPIGIVYDASLNVETMADLAGLRVGIPGRFGAAYSGLTALLETSDLNETDIDLQEIGFNAPEVFCVGAVDASVVYINNEPLQIRDRAMAGDCGDVADVAVLPVAESLDLVSNGIITSIANASENPDEVANMVSAYDAGLRLTINNPAQAYLLSAPFIDGLSLSDDLRLALETLSEEQTTFLETNPDREAITASRSTMLETLSQSFEATELLQFQVLLASIELWDADQLGYSDVASWENMQTTLLSLGQLPEAIELETIFTNDFLLAGE